MTEACLAAREARRAHRAQSEPDRAGLPDYALAARRLVDRQPRRSRGADRAGGSPRRPRGALLAMGVGAVVVTLGAEGALLLATDRRDRIRLRRRASPVVGHDRRRRRVLRLLFAGGSSPRGCRLAGGARRRGRGRRALGDAAGHAVGLSRAASRSTRSGRRLDSRSQREPLMTASLTPVGANRRRRARPRHLRPRPRW